MKRILTLHLPISEYDTHGSDSDNGELRRNQSASQELVSFRQRMSRGKSTTLHYIQHTHCAYAIIYFN